MEVTRFAILGLGTGAVYAMLAQGLVLVYRGSGILNFAQGAIAMFGAYAYYQISVRLGAPLWAGFLSAVVLSALVGVIIHLVVLRPMRRSSALARVAATLGVLTILQAAAALRYGNYPLQVPSVLPKWTVHLVSHQLIVGVNTIIIFVVGSAITLALTIFYRRAPFGKVTAVVAENELVAASLGHSPDRIAALNWALGSAVAGVAGVFIAPIIYLEPFSLVLLIIPAVSAALIGEFSSFPVTLGVALLLGIANSEITRYVSTPGWSTAAPFIVIAAFLVLSGRGVPLRSFVADRLPEVGFGRLRPGSALILWAAGALLLMHLKEPWAAPLTTTLAFAIVCLSVVVVTGYGGQLSLAQAVLAGIGAFAAAKLDADMPFLLAVLVAAVVTAGVGLIVGLPALRTRGITLAIVTLGLGASVVAVVFGNANWTEGSTGIQVKVPRVFGWNVDPYAHAGRYGTVVLTLLALLCVLVANLRRGTVGRRLLAVRSNERAAAAMGVNVASVKLYAFTVGAAIAGLGGVFLAFQQSAIAMDGNTQFSVLMCILVVAAVVVAGVGVIPGSIFGSLLLAGGITSKVLDSVGSIDEYLPLAGGILLVITLIATPDGIVETNRKLLAAAWAPMSRRWEGSVVGRRLATMRSRKAASATEQVHVAHINRQSLKVKDLVVTFGGVTAVDHVSLEVRPGEVHGIIGPNGAGKTTLIDGITGFVKTASGTVSVGERVIDGWSPRRRARFGLSRSFQSLELFDDLTVLENLAVASDEGAWIHYLRDLVHPGRVELNATSLEAIKQFELEDIVGLKPRNISFGRRKTVAIARAIAGAPSVLLLDEPAAGLDDHEAASLARLIRELADDWGIGVLLVEHKVDMIMSISDRVTVMTSGGVLTSGSPAEISQDPLVHAAYLGTPPDARNDEGQANPEVGTASPTHV